MALDATAPRSDVVDEAEPAVRCARCGHGLTTEAEAVAVAGRHAHVFMNPSGIIFHVVCFRDVPGARVEGVPDAETSWFPGTAWIYAHCGSCNAHVGWRYVRIDAPAAGDVFFALIEDCIVRP